MSEGGHGASSPMDPLLATVLSWDEGGIHTDADAVREAILLDDLDSLKKILERCADRIAVLDDPHGEMYTPLELAAGKGNLAAIRLLAAHGAGVNGHSRHCGGPLFRACEDSKADAVLLLLELGADPNARDFSRRFPQDGETALINALYWAGEARHSGQDGAADREIVRGLLDHGADINATSDGETALMKAVHNAGPDPEMVRLLLAGGADIRARDKDGRTAREQARSLIEWSISHGHTPRPESVEILSLLQEAEHARGG